MLRFLLQANEDLNLSSKQHVLFEQFKKSIEDILKPGYYLHADSELVKFCFARKWDLKKSESMFRQAMKLRETRRLDHILEEYEEPEVVS
ncbi:hypothetical protein EB796_011822 [Bugula neritina]|uniref:CRAL/TRIO N-terminal domain-containing protein n=1 Tax=Bugula neritina TaxID=10212 RepID=A0A7J7JVJ9_BUGNE|nr:hypothetical protein EB796_011822 [Bugula neritina]